jgi:hypothetical protein
LDDVVLAYKLNEETLDQGLSFTVRLVVPSKYVYTRELWVVSYRFTMGKELDFGRAKCVVTSRTCGRMTVAVIAFMAFYFFS